MYKTGPGQLFHFNQKVIAVYFTKRTITQASKAIPIAIEIQKATVFLFGYSLKICCGMILLLFN